MYCVMKITIQLIFDARKAYLYSYNLITYVSYETHKQTLNALNKQKYKTKTTMK